MSEDKGKEIEDEFEDENEAGEPEGDQPEGGENTLKEDKVDEPKLKEDKVDEPKLKEDEASKPKEVTKYNPGVTAKKPKNWKGFEFGPGVIKPFKHKDGTMEFSATVGPYGFRSYWADSWSSFYINKDGNYFLNKKNKPVAIPDRYELMNRVHTFDKDNKVSVLKDYYKLVMKEHKVGVDWEAYDKVMPKEKARAVAESEENLKNVLENLRKDEKKAHESKA